MFPLVQDAADPRYREAASAVAIALEAWTDTEFARGLGQVFDDVNAHATKEMSQVMGIDFGKVDPSTRRTAWVKANVNLIKSVSFERLNEMQSIIEESVNAQIHPSALRGRLQEQFGLTKSRADLIARDQTLKLNSQLAQERAKSVGVSTYTWVCSRDERVRGNPSGKYANSHSDHWVLHGTVQKYAEPPVTNRRTGERNHPGQDYQCRCVAVPNTDELLGL